MSFFQPLGSTRPSMMIYFVRVGNYIRKHPPEYLRIQKQRYLTAVVPSMLEISHASTAEERLTDSIRCRSIKPQMLNQMLMNMEVRDDR